MTALDENIAPYLNKTFDLKMRYFWPLYSYYGKHHIIAQVFFIEGLKRSLDVYNPEEIIFYDHKFNCFMDGVLDVASIASVFLRGVETEILSSPQADGAKVSFSNKISRWSSKLAHRPVYTIKSIVDLIDVNIRFRSFSERRRTILLHGELYDFGFLQKKLRDYNVVYYPNSRACSAIGLSTKNSDVNVDVDFDNFDFIEEKDDPLVDTFLADIQEDFNKNIGGYISAICQLKLIEKRHPISFGIWGSPPVSGTKALIFEYLSSEGVTVLGGQHGCLYGEAHVPWHFDSDFNRCEYFVSYGFTGEDLSRLYPNRSPKCAVLPLGAERPVYSSKQRREIDILFPITNSMSILEGGMSRISPEKLAGRQVELLEYLNTLRECKVAVKPFAYSTFDQCGPLIVMKRLSRLELVSNITLKDFLHRFTPRAVLVEYPSQPLLECLHLDTEIFLMNDPINPYDEKALRLLRRRVHYAEDVKDIIETINMFLNGKLEKKRDDTFYKHYVYKEHRKERIMTQIKMFA
ncbi:MAG: hypothetical protein ACW97O_00070 [Candidatus Thorarchaeota archaeon]